MAGKASPLSTGSDQDIYRLRVALHPEDEGGYSVRTLDLPGVVSEGDSQEESLAMIADAAREVIRTYLEGGEKIPWRQGELESDEVMGAVTVEEFRRAP